MPLKHEKAWHNAERNLINPLMKGKPVGETYAKAGITNPSQQSSCQKFLRKIGIPLPRRHGPANGKGR